MTSPCFPLKFCSQPDLKLAAGIFPTGVLAVHLGEEILDRFHARQVFEGRDHADDTRGQGEGVVAPAQYDKAVDKILLEPRQVVDVDRQRDVFQIQRHAVLFRQVFLQFVDLFLLEEVVGPLLKPSQVPAVVIGFGGLSQVLKVFDEFVAGEMFVPQVADPVDANFLFLVQSSQPGGGNEGIGFIKEKHLTSGSVQSVKGKGFFHYRLIWKKNPTVPALERTLDFFNKNQSQSNLFSNKNFR